MVSPRSTLLQVAQELGLSKMSISRALNGGRGVSEKTRAEVRALAQKMGYIPDPAISAAMTRMRGRKANDGDTIAWLTSHGAPRAWKDNFMMCEWYEGAAEQAARLGYRLEEFCVNHAGMTYKRMGEILYNRSIRGVIVAPLVKHGPIESFPWQHFASVCIGHSVVSPAIHRSAADQFQVVQVAWQSLTQRGYNRIGLCLSESHNTRVNNLSLSSFLGCQHLQTVENRVPPMVTADWNSQRFLEWFNRYKPDVVLSFAEVYDWMKEAGIRVPEQCGFAVLNFDESRAIAGVDHHNSDLGAAAVSLVASELNANQHGIPETRKSMLSECTWTDAPTVRSAKPKRPEERVHLHRVMV